MKRISVRPASVNDAESIAWLVSELGYPSTSAETRDRLWRVKGAEGVFVCVAELDGEVAGLATCHKFFAVHLTEPAVWLTSLVVSSEYRGEGIGQALVAECEAWAKSQGAKRLSLTSANHRDGAHQFYLSLGYEQSGVRFAKIF